MAQFYFDLIGCTDKQARDIGLKSRRKGGWWLDLMSPCLASDFKDGKDEYMSEIEPTGYGMHDVTVVTSD